LPGGPIDEGQSHTELLGQIVRTGPVIYYDDKQFPTE
jgi:hypothetical protein